MTENNGTTSTPPANLAVARKAQTEARAAAKKAHPAGTATKVPAKRAPAAETPAKKASADKAPRKARQQSGREKLRWVKEGKGLVATTFDGTVYSIIPGGDGKFRATIKMGGGKPQTLLDGVSDGRAYRALNRLHHYDEQPQSKAGKASA